MPLTHPATWLDPFLSLHLVVGGQQRFAGHLLWARACPGCWTRPSPCPLGTQLKAEMGKTQVLTAQCDTGSPGAGKPGGRWRGDIR